MSILDELGEALTGSRLAETALLRIYRDSMLDNVRLPFRSEITADASAPKAAALPVNVAERIADIRSTLELPLEQLSLGILFRIEAELWNYFTDEVVISRFWTVRDRFDRVVTLASRTSYEATVPAKTDEKWQQPGFLRTQALALIDTIQNNTLINLEREHFANRLRRMVFGVGVVLLSILLVCFKMAAADQPAPLMMYYAVLFFLGMTGACISYARRLQGAVDHNALAGNGLEELNTIANNRITALTTMMMGGVFAIILYWLVVSQAFAALIPAGNAQPGLSTSLASIDVLLAGKKAELAARNTQLQAAEAKLAAAPVAPAAAAPAAPAVAAAAPVAAPAASPAVPAAGAEPAPTPTPAQLRQQIADLTAEIAQLDVDNARMQQEVKELVPSAMANQAACSPKEKACDNSFGRRAAFVLGLADARSLYLLLVLAFLSGFAEQLVPDALDRLAKRMGKAA